VDLLDEVWGESWIVDDHVVDVHVALEIINPDLRERVRTVAGRAVSALRSSMTLAPAV
jgi:DNA-binding response OmpR family regulator